MQHKSRKICIFLGVCCLYACIHLDRQILGVLAESVKSDLHLQDRDLGTLTGSAFSIAYALLGLYFGALADRANRLALVRTGAWVWSLACIGAAFAPSYSVLVASRAGVAVGEAIATPAAVSLIAELAGERYRARVASLFLTSAFIGAGSAAILGGVITGLLEHRLAMGGWRVTLVAAGLPGILGALCLGRFDYPETNRSARGPRSNGSGAFGLVRSGVAGMLVGGAVIAVLLQMYCTPSVSVPLGVVCASLIATWWARGLSRSDAEAFRATLGQRTFQYVVVAFAAVLFMDSAASFWLIPYAQRRFDLPALTVGTQLGALMIVGGVVGCLLGGWFADRWRSIRRSGRAWTALIVIVAEAGALLMALAQAEYQAFLLACAAFCLFSGGWVGVAAALAFDAVPAEHRGTGTAVYFLVTTLLGPGLGPFLVGWGSDLSHSLSTALAWSCTAILIGVAVLVRLSYELDRDIPRETSLAEPG
jgi:MFS family permease